MVRRHGPPQLADAQKNLRQRHDQVIVSPPPFIRTPLDYARWRALCLARLEHLRERSVRRADIVERVLAGRPLVDAENLGAFAEVYVENVRKLHVHPSCAVIVAHEAP
jgi:hypothetical protein